MIHLDIPTLEYELRQRWRYPYHWPGKQTDEQDQATRFIYEVTTFDGLIQEIRQRFSHHPEQDTLTHYALNRWYNYWSAMGIEAIFCAHQRVTAARNPRDRRVDFFIDTLPFDLKTTVFPRGYPASLRDAIAAPWHLIDWLYEHQSRGQRCHYANRLFLVLHAANGQHWKRKAHLNDIQHTVRDYLAVADFAALPPLRVNGHTVTADIVWFIE